MPDHNLNYTDKMAMKVGVKWRAVGRPRLASAMQLPLSAKLSLRETKRILRASQKNRLPSDILNRPKQGFGVPVRSWLRGPARDLMEDLVSPATISARGCLIRMRSSRLNPISRQAASMPPSPFSR